MSSSRRFVLTLSCPDRSGIVAAVSGFIAEHGGSISEARHHSDPQTDRFFLRQEVLPESLPFDADQFRGKFRPIAERFAMDWKLWDTAQRKRIVILVSKHDHCLSDLLHRWRSGEMDYELVGVVSNHEDCRSFVEWHGVTYHHVPVAQDKEAAFRQIDVLIAQMDAGSIVLARYMQILPPWLCRKYPGRILNIHHSFLPSFVGARPYHQAHERGVKYVGATCHYVTEHLDEGPIIEQDAIRTNHADTVEELTRMGRDVEKAVLARGLRYHLEDRVLLNGKKTIVFD